MSYASAAFPYAGADEDRSRQNVNLTAPAADTAKPSAKPTKNWRANCALVMSSIALIIAILIGVLQLYDRGYLNAASLGSQVDISSQTTTEAPFKVGTSAQTPQCPPPSCPSMSSTTPPPAIPDEDKPGSAVYIRWGRTVCPDTASLVYKGIAGGKWYAHSGSGSNYLCLPETPEYDEYQAGHSDQRALVYSTEYQFFSFPHLTDKHNHDVPCSVCQSTNGNSLAMIPAKKTCPDTWTREYYGYLMAGHYTAPSTEFVCVDRNPEVRAGTAGNTNGALLYPVEVRCGTGTMPCAPYVDGAELTCVVCTK